MGNPVGSASRNAAIMTQARAQPNGAVVIKGNAVPTALPAVDPKVEAFGAWLIKAHPELSGLGGGARRDRMMPQLLQEFEPIWQALQRPAPAPSPTPGTIGSLLGGGQ